MHKEKRKRLESQGWKVGSASEFLELTPDEEAFIELKLRLGVGLRERRRRRRLSQSQLAKTARSSQSRVAKMEAGDPTVSVDLLIRTLLALGTTPKELARLITGGVPTAG
jgi:hypothetical protein